MSDTSSERPPDERAHRQTVRKNISDGAALSAPFLIMNALATVIACCGLLQDSAAVVIGAMVIATLMGPIRIRVERFFGRQSSAGSSATPAPSALLVAARSR
jgi:hypothetical protein